MKIKTTHTTTETKEVEVSLPAFTRVKSWYGESYYFIQNENKITKIDWYENSGIINFSHVGNIKDAFEERFEYISEVEFLYWYKHYVYLVSEGYKDVKLGIAQLQADAKAEQERAEKEEEIIED